MANIVRHYLDFQLYTVRLLIIILCNSIIIIMILFEIARGGGIADQTFNLI